MGQRLMSWPPRVAAGAEELVAASPKLGELRAHFNGYLRRAVDGLKDVRRLSEKSYARPQPNQEVQTVVSPILVYIDTANRRWTKS